MDYWDPVVVMPLKRCGLISRVDLEIAFRNIDTFGRWIIFLSIEEGFQD